MLAVGRVIFNTFPVKGIAMARNSATSDAVRKAHDDMPFSSSQGSMLV